MEVARTEGQGKDRRQQTRGRHWSWAALIGAVIVMAAELPTWGLSIVLAPLTFGLSLIASQRSPRDGAFWVGLTLNVLLLLGFAATVIGLFTGDISIGFE